MKIKTTSTFTLEPEEAAALGTVVDLLNEIAEECDKYVAAILSFEDSFAPFADLIITTNFLNRLWADGSASVSTTNYEEDDE